MLPKVKRETRLSLAASVVDNENALQDAIRLVDAENPEVAGFMANIIGLREPGQLYDYADVLTGMLGVYELLHRQDEADQMNEDFS